MKASELRIGNYVLPDGDISQEYQVDEQDYIQDTFIRLEPIMLTDEWFIKFGFSVQEYFRLLGDFCMKQTYDGFVLIGEKFSIGREITYVHQLQNLYFALTGEELTIK